MSAQAHALVAVLSIGTILFILRLVSRGVLKAKYSLLWLTIGVFVAAMAAVPSLLDTVADALGVSYPPALWLMMGMAFLFVLAVHFSWELSRMEGRVRTLAEEVALLRTRLDDPGPGAEKADLGAGETLDRPESGLR